LLARLLTPEDYGLYGMVAVVINFVQMFKELGLSAATIQKKEINHQQVSTLFWINVAVGIVLAVIVIALAPVVALFYGEPRLQHILVALASVFVFSGLTVQHQALLRRQMHFTSLAKINVISMAVATVAAMVAAWYGAGYWALVLISIVTAIANVIGVWLACSWRPGLPVWKAEIGEMLAFGGNITGFNCVNYFSRNLDNILIGRYWGANQLGLYAKAYQMVLLPTQQINFPITTVALPALSSLQSEPEKYCRFYYKAILTVTTFSMPIIALLFVIADKAVLILLGQQWLSVVPILQFLMPAAFMNTFTVATAWVYQSLGRSDRQFRIGLIMSAIDVLIFLISVRWGSLVLAAAYGLSRPIVWIPNIIYCYQGTPLELKQLAGILYRPVIASITAAVVLISINQYLPNDIDVWLILSVDSLLYSLLYLSIWLIFPDGKTTLLEMLHMVKVFKTK
jgi:O-antigen/teichoic acid export membrane protein